MVQHIERFSREIKTPRLSIREVLHDAEIDIDKGWRSRGISAKSLRAGSQRIRMAVLLVGTRKHIYGTSAAECEYRSGFNVSEQFRQKVLFSLRFPSIVFVL